MRKLILAAFCMVSVFILSAQRVYFIYLQTEAGQPFFVRMNDQLYSSSPSGYMIISNLKDSTYNFRVGFPGKDLDLNFKSIIYQKDHGYLIKDFGEKGWGLFDLQTLNVQMSSSPNKTSGQILNNPSEVNAFTDLLSRAADDPSLKQSVVIQTQEKKPQITQSVSKETKDNSVTKSSQKPIEEIKPEIKNSEPEKKAEVVSSENLTAIDSSVVKTGDKKSDVVKPDDTAVTEKPVVVSKEQSVRASQVSQISKNITPDGIQVVFVDINNGKTDTVKILIPEEVSLAREENKVERKEEKKFLEVLEDTTSTVASEPEKAGVKKEKFRFFKRPVRDTTSAVSTAPIKAEEKKEKFRLFKRPAKDTASVVTTEPEKSEVKKEKLRLFKRPAKDTVSVVATEPAKPEEKKEKFRLFKRPVKDTTVVVTTEPAKPEEKKEKFRLFKRPDKDTATVVATDAAEPQEKKEKFRLFKKSDESAIKKQTCKGIANENDFLKLRRKMAGETNDDAMIDEAKKYFRTRCFTTEQIKNLSAMFLSAAGKFNFFDAAYEYVSDVENFASLASELKDEYYNKRFMAMLPK